MASVEDGDSQIVSDESQPVRVALVLGSGGARGYAHIVVVQVVEELGAEIVAVAGSSMGACVGGMYCAGKLDEFTEWAVGLGQFEVLRLMDVSLSAKGAIRGEKIFKVVGDLIGDVEIQDLPIPYTAVAVDLLAHREVWFQRGPLEVAIRASTAIPSFVQPVSLDGRVLVDGGLLDPVPVAPLAAAHADLIVAVSLDGRGPAPDRPVAVDAGESSPEELSTRMRGSAAKWFDSDLLASVRKRLPDELEDSVRSRLDTDKPTRPSRQSRASRHDSMGSVEVMQLSFEAMQAAVARTRLAAYPPDVMISVPRNAARTLDMHKAPEMIELGRALAEEAFAGTLEQLPSPPEAMDTTASAKADGTAD